jgi:hypothetical protein
VPLGIYGLYLSVRLLVRADAAEKEGAVRDHDGSKSVQARPPTHFAVGLPHAVEAVPLANSALASWNIKTFATIGGKVPNGTSRSNFDPGRRRSSRKAMAIGPVDGSDRTGTIAASSLTSQRP